MMLFILGSVCVLSAIGYGLILLGRELVSAADQAEKEIIAARAMRHASTRPPTPHSSRAGSTPRGCAEAGGPRPGAP